MSFRLPAIMLLCLSLVLAPSSHAAMGMQATATGGVTNSWPVDVPVVDHHGTARHDCHGRTSDVSDAVTATNKRSDQDGTTTHDCCSDGDCRCTLGASLPCALFDSNCLPAMVLGPIVALRYPPELAHRLLRPPIRELASGM